MYGYNWKFWFDISNEKYCGDQFEEALLDLGWGFGEFNFNQYSIHKWRS